MKAKDEQYIQLQEGASQATILLKSMSNSSRLLILCTLIDKPGTSSGELSQLTGLTPSATSQHLAKMKEDGLIESKRVAKKMNYFIKNIAVEKIVFTLKSIYCSEEF